MKSQKANIWPTQPVDDAKKCAISDGNCCSWLISPKKDSDSDISCLCSIHGLLKFRSAQEIVGQRPRDHEADRSCEASQAQHAN